MDNDKIPVYYSTDELAAMLKTTHAVIRAAVAAGRIRAIKVGTGYRFSQDSVDAYLKAQERNNVAAIEISGYMGSAHGKKAKS